MNNPNPITFLKPLKVEGIVGAPFLDDPLKVEGALNKGQWLVETIEKEVGINMNDKHELIYYNLVRGLETLEYMTYKQLGYSKEWGCGSYVEGVKRRNNPTANLGLEIGEQTLLIYKNLLYGGLEDCYKPREILFVINRLKMFRDRDLRYTWKLSMNMYRTVELLVRDAILDDEVKRNIEHLGAYYNYYTNSG